MNTCTLHRSSLIAGGVVAEVDDAKKDGDTLGGIAAYYRVNMYSIHGYRSGNPALIYPGETLYW